MSRNIAVEVERETNILYSLGARVFETMKKNEEFWEKYENKIESCWTCRLSLVSKVVRVNYEAGEKFWDKYENEKDVNKITTVLHQVQVAEIDGFESWVSYSKKT